MNLYTSKRNFFLDFIKGLAIISVILYHARLFKYGYLGVDIFLVVGGYLITKSIVRNYDCESFSYTGYLLKRFERLWPLALLLVVASLALGYFVMLPSDYKAMAENAVGTATFSNNFIQYITSSNYWDVSNDYKPLMHTWYIGLVLQFYILYPVVFMLCHRFSRGWRFGLRVVLLIIFAVSLIYYLLPYTSEADKFYLLSSRLFEFAIGGLIALEHNTGKHCGIHNLTIAVVILLVILLVFNADIPTKQIRLLLTIGLTSVLVILAGQELKWNNQTNHHSIVRCGLEAIAYLGMSSYSLYIWHQPVLAFYRYAINARLGVADYVIVLTLSFMLGLLSYKLIEQRLMSRLRLTYGKKRMMTVCVCVLIACVTTVGGVILYLHHGVIRDVPEMDIYVNNPLSWEPQKYNARINQLDCDFSNNGRQNVLVLGDSYGRDWINVLLESHVCDSMNISYHNGSDATARKRIDKANYVFISCMSKIDTYYPLIPLIGNKPYYRVGTKAFGIQNGNIYNHHRYAKGYFTQTVAVREDMCAENVEQKAIFGDRYIDMFAPIAHNGVMPVFTPCHKFFSHDCMHLSKAGCKWYAKNMDIAKYFMDQ